ncbi:MAG: gliding motility-associated C-terminal domain-containing protein [Chitinophagaceae bacterium]|nr:gliding motility-associated C-terminal domain-containing protein [Chitinophagaceae bacterium]
MAIIAGLTTTTQGFSQACTTLGQNPETAFPVCGTTVFKQSTVPLCVSNSLFVPGCDDGTANYENRNPFWYKFHCYVSGTLGFTITPNSPTSDYDWQLYDITGLPASAVYTNRNIVVTGNWSATYGPTGASASGVDFIQCASSPDQGLSTFAKMPNLIAGHDYILLVSHWTNTQAGYDLSFGGGTAVITDPNLPAPKSIKPDCDGLEMLVTLNKPIRCNSLAADGSDFVLQPANATVVGVSTNGCSNGFDFTEITIRLSNPIPAGDYELLVNTGTDGNTLLDACGNSIPPGTPIPFTFVVAQPIFADSIGTVGCAPTSVDIYFPKKINCASINADGSNFIVTGPSAVSVASVQTVCTGGETEVITLRFTEPITVGGTYNVTMQAGVDGSTIVDECGLNLPIHTRSFTAADTVNADFTYIAQLDCRLNTVLFSHDGAHNVNNWNWTLNNGAPVTTREHTAVLSSTSTTTVRLQVSNGVCTDEASVNIIMDNEIIADFEIPAIICPEDKLEIVNNSRGLIDSWRWTFEPTGSSILKDPAPLQFPINNRESYYNIKLVATNNTLGCSDSIRKRVTVLDNCYIAVPTAFTPNGDGLNDYLFPNNAMKADNLEFRVYNRWGQLVFLSRDWTKKWDGRVNGQLQSTGVYVWFLSYTHRDTGQKVFQKGTTTLIL